MLGNNLDKAGDHDASIVPLSQAWRLGRHDPLRFDIANDLAHSHDMAGWYEPAISWGLQSLSSKDDYLLAHIVLAAAYGRLGRTEGARPHVEAVLASRPGFSSGKHWSRLAYVRDEDRDHLVDGLRKAGLPD
jgi:hypothetical protein